VRLLRPGGTKCLWRLSRRFICRRWTAPNKEVRSSWERADAKVGWVELSGLDRDFHKGDRLSEDEIAAFVVEKWQFKTVASLPSPDVDFAIIVMDMEFDDNAIKELVKIEHLGKMRGLALRYTKVSRASFGYIAELKELRSLSLPDFGGDLKELGHLKHLSCLSLASVRALTDDELSEVGKLGALEALNLNNTLISNKGLGHLGKLKKLKQLNLSETKNITDLGIKDLAALGQLEMLNLDRTRISGEGLKWLEANNKLSLLVLGGDDLTLEGLKQLVKLKEIRSLHLSGDSITDQVLDLVGQMDKLETVVISSKMVTDLGVLRLRQSLPSLDVIRFK
jgi:hypothetical protein